MIRNCRHCANMVCGDANWCEANEETMSDRQINVYRECPDFRYCPIDAMTLEDPEHERAVMENRERAKYIRRMAGDWS